MSITQELLYLLLLYAVLSDDLSLTTALLIAFAIILLGPCISKFCCNGTNTANLTSFAALNNLI